MFTLCDSANINSIIEFVPNCMRQTDLKSLIAYSSVAHTSMVIGGIMTLSYWGICIFYFDCSSWFVFFWFFFFFFCLSNISYERFGRQSPLISMSAYYNISIINNA
jgi:NADH-ubiquinone oxidoreductase chain 4